MPGAADGRVTALALGRAEAPRPSKAALFAAELRAPRLSFLMEAHNALSAKIVEEAGFRAIWASGLTISAALGLRDSNEASWTQVLDVLEFMSDSTSIPILADGDTGYGNFNNVRRLVKKLCQRGIAALCIEDKLFPKTNSFIGEGQPLAGIDEFCGKIKAGKDSQTDEDFCLVARVEALVSGLGLSAALKRAEAYHRAGADAILIHSKARTADEVLGFAAAWGNRCPLVIVPTMYHRTAAGRFRDAAISMVIWANQNLRASISAMREVSARVHDDESILGVEERLASIEDVFALTDSRELYDAEDRYLAPAGKGLGVVVLAASRGEELGALTADRPKCMLDIRGQPLLHRLVATFKNCGLREVTVVGGYRKEAIDVAGIRCLANDAYERTGEVVSLACAADRLSGGCVLSYGDILFRRYILESLIDAPGEIVLAIDARWRERTDVAPDRQRDFVVCSKPFTGRYLDDDMITVSRIGVDLAPDRVHGEWIGLAKLGARGGQRVRAEIEAMAADGSLEKGDLPDLFERLVTAGERVSVLYISGHWLDVNDAFDLASARNFL